LISIRVHYPIWLFFTNLNHRDVINRYPPEAHLARAAHLGLAKLCAYSSKIREIPVYLAAVVLDPRQKSDYFELGVEQGDWTEREVEAARGVVQLLWVGEYQQSGLQFVSSANSPVIREKECLRRGTLELDKADEHHRQWQAKRRRITPGSIPYIPNNGSHNLKLY